MAAMEQGQDTCSMEQGQDISNIKLLLLGQDGARGAPAGNADCPTHLVVLMHGVMGRSSHMRALGEAAQRRLGSGALIFSTSSYARLWSLRGTRFAGNAVFAEIEAIAQRHKTLTHITLCGYSFGGIVAMWVAGRLHETAFLGLSPVNFITVACPHLGVSEPTGGGLLQVLRRQFIRSGGVQTGAELSHGDASHLLLHLTRPSSAGYAGMKLAGEQYPHVLLVNTQTGDRLGSVIGSKNTEALAAAAAPGGRCEAAGRAGGGGDGCGGQVAADCDEMPLQTLVMMVGLSPLVLVWLVLSIPIALLIVCLGRFLRGVLWLSGEDAHIARELKRMSLCGAGCGGGGSAKAGEDGDGRGITRHDASCQRSAEGDNDGTGLEEERSLSRQELISHWLNSLGWAKYGVLFTYKTDGLGAVHTHGHIIVRNLGLNDVGRDVVEHIASHMLPF